MRISAWFWPMNGVVELGAQVPEGAVEIAKGERAHLKRVVENHAQLASDNETLFVPGFPQARSEQARVGCLQHFRVAIQRRLQATA